MKYSFFEKYKPNLRRPYQTVVCLIPLVFNQSHHLPLSKMSPAFANEKWGIQLNMKSVCTCQSIAAYATYGVLSTKQLHLDIIKRMVVMEYMWESEAKAVL